MRIVIAVALVLGSFTVPAYAWGPAGHKIVASVAFNQLNEAEQKKVIEILKSHPRFDEDFTDKMPDEVTSGDGATQREWLFQQAAIWPDLAKGLPAAIQGKFNRPIWHFINKPVFLTDADKMALEAGIHVNLKLDPPSPIRNDMNVIQAIRFARSEITDSNSSAEEKGLYLSWLFHTVGDIHQPLHSSALFTRKLFPLGDKGGNGIKTRQRGNLHSVWDGFPGGNLKFATLRNRALILVNDSSFTPARVNALATLDEQTWLDESAQLARDVVYGPEIKGTLRELEDADEDIDQNAIDLSETYLKEGGAVADRRLVEAGVRLGRILKDAVK